MEKLRIGENYKIHCHKHDSVVYKAYDEAILLEINDDYLVFGNNRAKVTEVDGRSWRTKEPAIMFFFRHRWFNIIGQYKKTGIYYYCNMASPFVVDQNTIKLIDYDLDLRVFPDGSYKILDRGEYNYHKSKMNYSKDLDQVLKYELTNLIEMAKEKKGPFAKGKIEYYYNIYKDSHKKITNH